MCIMEEKFKGFGLFDPLPKIIGITLTIPALIGGYAFLTAGEGKFHDTVIEILYVIAFIALVAIVIACAYCVFWLVREIILTISEKIKK